jgi:hypothetical protein
MSEQLVSKVLVLEDTDGQMDELRDFCVQHGLVPLKVRKNRLMNVLRANIDLGAIFMPEDYGATLPESYQTAVGIHAVRPELPIVLRRSSGTTLDDLPASIRGVFCAAYSKDEMDHLGKVIEEYIFTLYYPCDLVRGISEITEFVLASQFRDRLIVWDSPYIVRDRVIFGELFSLIPLESNWCRGYMMIQTEEQAILNVLEGGETVSAELGFRRVNSLLGEITNMIWGSFKNRFIGSESPTIHHQIEVPLVVNHKHKYVSFGTENPQLCFLFRVVDAQTGEAIKFYQRFIFNLNWSPEDFREIGRDADSLVESGELELF